MHSHIQHCEMPQVARQRDEALFLCGGGDQHIGKIWPGTAAAGEIG